MVIEFLIKPMATFYLQFISKDIAWFLVFCTCFMAIGSVMSIFFVTESPKLLIMQKRFTEARDVLNIIAKKNRKPSFLFDKEDFDIFSENSTVQAKLVVSGETIFSKVQI